MANQQEDKKKTNPQPVTADQLSKWAMEDDEAVALHLRQQLAPVEEYDTEEEDGDDPVGIVYPPTYANIGYNDDAYGDGKRVALIDSPGSQANRLEPIFASKEETREKWLVPQIDIRLPERSRDCGTCGICLKEKRTKNDKCQNPFKWQETVSLLDLAHRSADAVVNSTPTLRKKIAAAFHELRTNGDAGPLCCIAPTSLVFGVWDSRGGSGEKRPRLIRSIIRAWDIEKLHAAAQFNSVWKLLDDTQREELSKAAKNDDVLSKRGFKDAPAVFTDKARTTRVLGGVFVKDRIERDVTINLVAIRGLRGYFPPKNDSEDDAEQKKQEQPKDATEVIRKYLLGLSLLAATHEPTMFLREGCHLRIKDENDRWFAVKRRGNPTPVDLTSEKSQKVIHDFVDDAVGAFRKHWPEKRETYDFEMGAARKLVTEKLEDDDSSGG